MHEGWLARQRDGLFVLRFLKELDDPCREQTQSFPGATRSGMLRKRIDITEEQLHWLKSIQQNVKLYHVPADWHRAALEQGGFTDVDCIYLRHKLGIFSGAKALVAI